MATEIFGPILPIQLDSRNVRDIVRGIQSRINIESGGQLTDFTPASPLAAISEGQGFAQGELQYYMNSLPEAVSIQWLRSLGIQRKMGSKSSVEVTFYRVPGYTRPVTIPPGVKLYANSGQVFILREQVSITGDSAVGIAFSERWGSVYNVPPSTITRIEKSFLGLDFLTNLASATGGSDLETVEQMKLRAFTLLGRRNLTSRDDFEAEVRRVASEADVVKVINYEERFGENSRGIFVVAGGANGAALSTTNKSLILATLRDRVPLDVKVYLASPTILPVEVNINIIWDPRVTTTFTDTLASQIKDFLQIEINPSTLGLGNNLSTSNILREVLNFDFVKEVPVLDVKEMSLNPEGGSYEGGYCGRFEGTENTVDQRCDYVYKQVSIRELSTPLSAPNSTSGFRLYRAVISLISEVDYSVLNYTYGALYDIV
jgi:uncharacterized phage protein gp47/JayE